MQVRIAAVLGAAALLGAAMPAGAADLPVIKASDSNVVPACATPGRLGSFLKSRNAKLDPRFESIAVEYMRHGEQLGLRWDIAFFQMLLETGNLAFGGIVHPDQNNFAGLGATGKRESGEHFKDVSTGVRAHLEHLLMYSGQHIDNPVAERTRKVQEWGVLTGWQKTIKGPMTFEHLARQWAPKSRHYVSDIENVADAFYDGACKAADPHPEQVAEARGGRGEPAKSKVAAATEAEPTPHDIATETRKRAVEEQRAEGGKRTGLGAHKLPEPKTEAPAAKAQPAVTILNGAAKPETPKAQAEEQHAAAAAIAPKGGATVQAVAVAPLAKQQPLAKEQAAKGKCNVWTASYGGHKAIIIRANAPDATNYTVLDVNEGAEKREAEAYIAAYAKGGQMVGEFQTSEQALDKAFELCPEG